MTPQRQVVLEALTSVTSHPTAAELYDLVRQRLPEISPGTVYRNLRVLQELGCVRELDYGPHASRFDATVEDHCHVRCECCGRIDDLPVDAATGLQEAAQAAPGWTIAGQRLEYHGLCPDCLRNQERSDNKEGEP